MAVVLLYELGEGAPEEALKADSGALGQLALALMQVCARGGGEGRDGKERGRGGEKHEQVVALALMQARGGEGGARG